MNRFYSSRSGSLIIGGALALVLASACSKKEKAEEKAPTPTAATAKDGAAAKPAVDPKAAEAEAKKKLENEKKIADALVKLEGDVAKEKERWTPELQASVKTLVETKFKTPKEAIAAAMASGHRVPSHIERDGFRRPLETLVFLGFTPSSKVVEMGMGGGWYTDILVPVVAGEGLYTGGRYSQDGPKDKMRTVYGMRQQAFLDKSTDLYGKAKTFDLGADVVVAGEAGSADLVLAIRELHNWQRRGTMDSNLKAVVDVLAPGGSFGVVQHRGKADAKAEESAELGYLPEAWVIAKVEAAGLKLVEKSEINANPKDTKDYEKGVWTLPPGYRLGDTDKEKYKAIGESDRMTLRFEKPKP